tara:strand:- start:266 stop:3157 length:2892 start_codon:yes stop_codon:yes gene_type:complete
MNTAKLIVWKTPFFKNISENGGAMAEAIKAHDSAKDIIIHSDTQKNGRVWGYTQPLKLLELIKSNKGIYEVITAYPHKLYFDIDKTTFKKSGAKGEFEGVSPSFLDDIKQVINKYFPNAELAISGSINPEKVSYHIICNNYTIHNPEEREYVKQIVKHLCENVDEAFDWKVYTKNRNMKCINQSKRDGRVQEIIENEDYRHHLITCFINDYSLPFPVITNEVQETIMIAKSKKVYDIATLPKLNLTEPADFDFYSCTPIQLLPMFPINKTFNHDYTHLVGRYCYYNDISLEHFLAWISKKHNPLTEEIKQKWANHFTKMEKFPKPSEAKIMAILSYYYPNMKKDKSYKAFANTFVFPDDKIKYIETITQDNFKSSEKYSLFNVGMGGGKTYQTIDYLKTVESGFIWLCPNKALANNTLNRLQEKEIQTAYYLDYNAKQKKDGALNDVKNLIIVLNSLHYVGNKKYGVVVIDEIETLIDKFLGDFMKNKKQIWDAFKYIILNAEKVIFLDAFITTKTLSFIKSLEKDASYAIYQRLNEPSTRTVEIMKTSDIMINDIITNIKNNKKCFIFYPYKKTSANGNIISMETLSSLLEKETYKKGIYYNADIDDVVKGGLKDVNKAWKNYDFIITNNIITCGVNYERKDFDFAYIFVASHNSPRDIIQVSYRARFLSSENIKLCYMGKMNQPNTFQIDTAVIDCPVYTKLINSILIEKHSPLKKTLQLFCNKAHYKFKINEKVLSADLKKYISDLISNCEVGFSYQNIDNIDEKYAEIIQQNVFSQTASMMDKIMLQKYFFQLTFKKEAEFVMMPDCFTDEKEISVIEHSWNENLSFFFSKNCELLKNPINIFNAIKELNCNEGIFPENIKNTILNENILDDIFKQFNFKYITRKSNTTKILKEIFNTFYMKNIIQTDYTTDSNKHINFTINDDYYNFLYNFANDYLRYEIYVPELECQEDYTLEVNNL